MLALSLGAKASLEISGFGTNVVRLCFNKDTYMKENKPTTSKRLTDLIKFQQVFPLPLPWV